MLHVYRYNYLQATQHSASLRPRTGQNRMGRKYFRESFVNIGFLQISTLLVFFTSLIILNTISENVPKTRKWTFRCYPIRRVSNILMGILHSTICLLANGWSPKMWETLRATRSAQYTLLYMYEHNEKFKPLKQSMILWNQKCSLNFISISYCFWTVLQKPGESYAIRYVFRLL